MRIGVNWNCPECNDVIKITSQEKPTAFKSPYMRVDCVACDSKYEIWLKRKRGEPNGVEIIGNVLVQKGIDTPQYIREKMGRL